MRFLKHMGWLVLALVMPVAAEDGVGPAPKLVWEANVLDAFVKAVEEVRPLVVVFAMDPAFRNAQGMNGSTLLLEEFRAPEVQALGKDAVFVICEYDHRTGTMADEYGRRMWVHLKSDELPMLSIIAPRTDVLTETYRMIGSFPAKTIAAKLKEHLPKALGTPDVVLPPAAPASSPVSMAPGTPAEVIHRLSQAMRAGDAMAVGNLMTAAQAPLYAEVVKAAGQLGAAKRRLLAAMDGQFGVADDSLPYGDDDVELRNDLQLVSAVVLEEAHYPALTVADVRVRIEFKSGATRTTEVRTVREEEGWKLQPQEWLGFTDAARCRRHAEFLNRLANDFDAIARQVLAGNFASREACRKMARELYLVEKRLSEADR